MLSAAAFFAELTRRAPSASDVPDPLAHAQRFIERHGETGEGRALLAVVRALRTGTGDFAESDVWSLSAESLALASALINARTEARYPDWRWHRAASYPSWRFLLDLHKKYGIT